MRRLRALVLGAAAGCAPAAVTLEATPPVLPGTMPGATPGPSAADLAWDAYFEDPDLVALLRAAVEHNLDLQIALERIEAARALVRAASGARLPTLEAFAGSGLSREGVFTTSGSGNLTTEIEPGRITPNPVGDLSLGVQASWEIDLWGRLRDLRGAARAQYLATVEGTQLVLSTLVAEVATTYYDLLAADRVHLLLVTTVEQQARRVELTRAQKAAGRADELAVRQLEAQLATTEALEIEAAQRITELEVQLNALLGQMPGPVHRTAARLDVAPAAHLGAGVPSELLRNRPDVREAEQLVAAAQFDVAAARAAFYPSLTLTASLGISAIEPRFLIKLPASVTGAVAGGLLAPLLNRRGLEAAQASAAATQRAAVHRYRQVVIASFGEVTAALVAGERTRESAARRARALASLTAATEAADALYRAGKATYLDVLVAQQTALAGELELIAARRDLHATRVRLYRALGGGWQGVLRIARPQAPTRPPRP